MGRGDGKRRRCISCSASRQPHRAPARGVRRFASARFRGLVWQSACMGRSRIQRPTGARLSVPMPDESARTALIDPIRVGVASGWRVIDAATLENPITLEADAVIVGTGAGGGVAAEILADAGLGVILVEEGPLKSSGDFRMREAEAYAELYQESAARKTRDKAISILQGRCVGGGTTVNWTSSFRTPPITLAHWAHTFGITGFGIDDLKPWFERMEARLAIAPWTIAPNPNNTALAVGTAKLGYSSQPIRRNVKGCWNLGYCGMGCPTNAKHSMLEVTDGCSGAPQSIYSDQFLDAAPPDGSIGFKLEAPPIHPLLTATTLPNHGIVHAKRMHELRHLHVLIALLRDGFHPQSTGG